MTEQSSKKALVFLVIFLTVFSGISAISAMWQQHSSNPLPLNEGLTATVPGTFSQTPAKQNTVITTLDIPGSEPTQVSYDPLNDRMYVSDYNLGLISVANTSTNTVVQNISLGSSSKPIAVAFDPANGYLYVGGQGSDNISVIDPTTNAIKENISMSYEIQELTYDSANTFLYASSLQSNSVSVINSTTNEVVGNLLIQSEPEGVAYDPANTYIYVSIYGSNLVQVFNSTTDSIVSSISVGNNPEAMAYDPFNSYIYVDNAASNNVSVINSTTNLVVGSINVGSGSQYIYNPEGIAYDPANDFIYLSNTESGNVSVINSVTNSIEGSVNVGSSPEGITYDPENSQIYVTNHNSNSISAIGYVNSYSVTFTESNLPSGSAWYINITGQEPSGKILGSSYTEDLVNGTYSYTSSSANGYAVDQYYTTFTVDGAKLNEAILFYKAYQVTFEESGLASGTAWNVNISGQQSSGAIDVSTYSINLPNGTYSYNVSTTGAYLYSNNGTFEITGSPMAEPVTFTREYTVLFYGIGLPYGQDWYLNLSNGHSYTSSYLIGEVSLNIVPPVESYIMFEVPNGTYTYTISTADKNFELVNVTGGTQLLTIEGTTSQQTSYGSFTVNGGTVRELANFTYLYETTFRESGLPAGSTWYLNLTNGQNFTSTSDSLSFSEPNGTYTYTISTADKNFSPSNNEGTFTVNNSTVSKSATFNRVLYNLTFVESGLPSGTDWYINGTNVSGQTGSQYIEFDLMNGTYSFTVTNLSSYYTESSHIVVSVNGRNSTEVVQFYHWAYITGTVTPGNGNLTINGRVFVLPSSGHFNVSVANGTYNVTVSDPGYHSYNTNVTVSNGEQKNLTIDLKPLSGSSIPIGVVYGLLGVVVALPVLRIVIYWIRRK